jgi:hypothetical protein
MRVIVCGGRDYKDRAHLWAWLDKFHALHRITELIEGGARGADTLAREWGHLNNVLTTTVVANWARYGRRAGPIRNQTMLDMRPDAVIAFPGNQGTAHMTSIARRQGVKVLDGSNLNWE